MERLRHIKPDWWKKVIVKNKVLIMKYGKWMSRQPFLMAI